MAKQQKTTISMKGTEVTIITANNQDYISLTDMVKDFEGGSALIEQWLKNKDSVLFLGVWEQLNNSTFNSLEFEGIKNESGRNSFYLSAKKWIEKTNAIGLKASSGRYGGTYAHKDIAFEFGSWLSPEFKLYLIKEYQRLKEDENQRLSLAWNLNRTLSKLEQLLVLANIESLNAEFIRMQLPQSERLQKLNQIAITQLKAIIGNPQLKKLK